MLARILTWSILKPWWVLALGSVVMAVGAGALWQLPIDAVPDLTNVQVQVLTSSPALGTLDLERFVTAPIEHAMMGLPDLKEVRSLTRTGGSNVTVVFADHVDPYFARMLVSMRLEEAKERIDPRHGIPELGPMASGISEIYQFEVAGDQNSMALRSLLDWHIAPRMRMVPGVVEVNTFGGLLKTYEVQVDVDRLIALNLTLADLFTALEGDNRTAGGGVILRGPEGLLIRADGLLRNLADITHTPIAKVNGVPITIGDVGTVRLAPMLRQGAATKDGKGEIVAGLAMMRRGENAREVAAALGEAVKELHQTLPPGVTIKPFYDRRELVDVTLDTITHNLAEGGILVVVVLFVMLRSLRAGLIAAAVIPASLLIAVIGMRMMGLGGNLMSLGAIDFGLVVDGAIILLENGLHHLTVARERLGRALTVSERRQTLIESSMEVRGATAFGELIVALVYLPILGLTGSEGKTFQPMAITVLLTLLGAFVLSLTAVPALASLALKPGSAHGPPKALVALERAYERLLSWCVLRPRLNFICATLLMAAAGVLASGAGWDFMPRLDEGTQVIEIARLPSTSLEESIRTSTMIENLLMPMPEVAAVVSKTGRPEIASDLAGPEMTDCYVMLTPRDGWPNPRLDIEVLQERFEETLLSHVPGLVTLSFSQPIEMRTHELLSGVRADLAVQLYGDDLQTLAALGAQVATLIKSVPGAADLRVDRLDGLTAVSIRPDRLAMGRLGIDARTLSDSVTAVGGRIVGKILEGEERYALTVRLAGSYRNDLDAIARLPLQTRHGNHVALQEVATLAHVDDPVVINREGAARRLVVQANVRGRDLGGFSQQVQATLKQHLPLPVGYRMHLGGNFENLQRAQQRLMWLVPLTLVLIGTLLVATFNDVQAAAIIFMNVPFAATGGVLMLSARGLPLSISAAVGFIALFGIATLNGLVLVSEMQNQARAGLDPLQAAVLGAKRRLLPVLTTASVAGLGFVPMALSHGAGAEVQRPLATVVIGGLMTATTMTLLALPTLWLTVAGRSYRRKVLHDAR